ncbi:replication-relaxation family protein [Bacillus paranthracis]|uniref:replication-relaxation family protein n=1 Tax=Bacillus paranthracis TaxID=2026186 RepID=UPI001E4977D9|nr:replication-relaxation family protein [Bacillus paranthracis]MCC2441843.1 replication-relaxation family protein [Bacillus paranthracis]
MNKRDKLIVDDINKFRVLSRDQIIDLYFSHLKNPISTCNLVLKRLQDRGYIKACKDFRPYLYVSADSKIKENSQKSLHFLKIVDVYIQLKKYDRKVSHVLIEPKIGTKGTVEPDLFCIFRNTPFFIEVQRSVYSEKVMNEKIDRYESLYDSREWKKFEWQQEGKEIFPIIILITDTHYLINSELRVLQFPDIHAFMKRHGKQENKKPSETNKNAVSKQMTSQNGSIKIVVK